LSDIEKASWNVDVSKQLGIGESTLRKWCIELEDNGYTFAKGAKGKRAFTDHDLAALLYFKNLTRAKNHTMKQAAIAVVEKYSKKGENEITTNTPLESIRSSLEKMIKDLLEHAKRQEEFNKSLLERLDRQNKYIKEILETLNSERKKSKNPKNNNDGNHTARNKNK
jgi:DNA-binding transcriptional MerR regulator